MAEVEKTTKVDTIHAEFEHVMKLFLEIKTSVCSYTDGVDLNEGDIGKSYEILLYQTCSLPLPDVLGRLLEHLDVVPCTINHKYEVVEHYHSSLLYDCLVIALEKNHQNVIDILLKCVVQKHTETTSVTTSVVQKHSDTTSVTTGTSSKGRFMTLHWAAANGDVEIIKMLIKAGIDVNQKILSGETALHVALDVATAEVLLNNGADVNITNRTDKSPLHCAFVSYRLGVIKQLIEKGAKLNTKSIVFNYVCESGIDANIASALMEFRIAPYGRNQMIKSCVYQAINYIKKGKLEKINPLCAKCKQENQAMVQKIRERHFGMEVKRIHEIPQLHYEILALQNMRETGLVGLQPIKNILNKSDTIVNAVNKFGTTALYLAVERNLFDVATLLLDSGADPNVATVGKHPLITACRFLSHNFVRLLLDRGAIPNVAHRYGGSPLFIAAESYDLALVKMLVEHGADVNRKNHKEETILHSVVENSFKRFYHCSGVGCVDTVKYLLDNGFNVNQTNAKGHTVITRVIDMFTNKDMRGRFSLISIPYQLFELLLERGADVNLVTLRGYNAMFSATKGESAYALQELLRHGGDAKSGKSLLGISCIKSDLRSARLLLAAGADPKTVKFKWLYWATKTDNTELINLLLNSGVIINTSNNDDTENIIPTLGDFYTPFCEGTECIIQLFKAGSSLQVLADCCRYRRKGSRLPFKCSLACLLCKAIVLAGYNVRLQPQYYPNWSDYGDLESCLEADSLTPPTLRRLCRTVIRRQLSAASGYRTIIPLIDVLEIPKQMQMYLRFEGYLTEVDLTVYDERSRCASCSRESYTFFRGKRVLGEPWESADERSDD